MIWLVSLSHVLFVVHASNDCSDQSLYKLAPTVHWFTVASRDNAVLNFLKKTADSKGMLLHVLGKELLNSGNWRQTAHWGHKLLQLNIFLHRPALEDDDLLLCTDGFDVAFVGDRETLLRKYYEFKKAIVFGGELGCIDDTSSVCSRFPVYDRQANFPYLNAGGFMGTVRSFKKILHNHTFTEAMDDQLFWYYRYIENTDIMAIDHGASIFLNLHGLSKPIDDMHAINGTFKFRDASPQFVHANGARKNLIVPAIAFIKNR